MISSTPQCHSYQEIYSRSMSSCTATKELEQRISNEPDLVKSTTILMNVSLHCPTELAVGQVSYSAPTIPIQLKLEAPGRR